MKKIQQFFIYVLAILSINTLYATGLTDRIILDRANKWNNNDAQQYNWTIFTSSIYNVGNLATSTEGNLSMPEVDPESGKGLVGLNNAMWGFKIGLFLNIPQVSWLQFYADSELFLDMKPYKADGSINDSMGKIHALNPINAKMGFSFTDYFGIELRQDLAFPLLFKYHKYFIQNNNLLYNIRVQANFTPYLTGNRYSEKNGILIRSWLDNIGLEIAAGVDVYKWFQLDIAARTWITGGMFQNEEWITERAQRGDWGFSAETLFTFTLNESFSLFTSYVFKVTDDPSKKSQINEFSHEILVGVSFAGDFFQAN
ncbi:MAG: hypothetical protein ACRC0X_06835 [Brevinema sp.]